MRASPETLPIAACSLSIARAAQRGEDVQAIPLHLHDQGRQDVHLELAHVLWGVACSSAHLATPDITRVEAILTLISQDLSRLARAPDRDALQRAAFNATRALRVCAQARAFH